MYTASIYLEMPTDVATGQANDDLLVANSLRLTILSYIEILERAALREGCPHSLWQKKNRSLRLDWFCQNQNSALYTYNVSKEQPRVFKDLG